MAFHPDKYQVISSSRNKITIHFAYRLLSPSKTRLTRGGHITNFTNKANRNRNLNIASCPTKELTYKLFVRPTVEDTYSVWDHYEIVDVTKLEMVQRGTIRQTLLPAQISITKMIQDLQWPSLQDRRRTTRLVLLLIYNIVND